MMQVMLDDPDDKHRVLKAQDRMDHLISEKLHQGPEMEQARKGNVESEQPVGDAVAADNVDAEQREGEALDEALFDSQIREIKGAAHNPMETHPGEFNRIILDFLEHKNTPKSDTPTRQFGQ